MINSRSSYSIGAKMLLAFAIITFLGIFSNFFVYLTTTKIGNNFTSVSNTSIPLVKANSQLRRSILESSTSLKDQIITGNDPSSKSNAIAQQNKAWNDVFIHYQSIEKLAVNTGFSPKVLTEIYDALISLKKEQQVISNIANTVDNEPAVKLLVTQAIPLATSMLSLLSKISEMDMAEDADDEEKAELNQLLVESQISFATAISELRAFLLTRDKENIDGFDQAWILNSDAFTEVQDDYEDAFTPQQLQLWQNYSKEREKLAPITIMAFEKQASEQANFAIYHLRTTVSPLTDKIFDKLDSLSEHVVNVSQKGIEDTDSSLTDMLTIIFISSILTVIIASTVSITFSQKLKLRVQQLLKRAHNISGGNLTTQDDYFDIRTNDELGQLSESFNHMTLSLSTAISTVKRQSRQVGHSAHQVAAIASEITVVAQKENESYSDVMRVTESFMDLLIESSTAISDSEKVLEEAKIQADLGITAVNNNLTEMNRTVEVVELASKEVEELKLASEEIESVTDAISTVADQTALIALNAAIEAARAGEQGRGFAVVADEVRNLAQRTASSTDEIRVVISQLITKVADVIRLMSDIIEQVDVSKSRSDDSGNTLRSMTKTIDNIISVNQQVSIRSNQQSEQMHEMQIKLQHLFSSLQQNAEKAQMVSMIGGDLYVTSELVNQLMDGFNFDNDGLRELSTEEQRSSTRLEAKVKVEVIQQTNKHSTITRELSCTGCGITLSNQLNQELEVDSEVTLVFYVPKKSYQDYMNQPPLSIVSRVIWKQEDDIKHTYYGLEFLPRNDTERKAIKELYLFFDE